VDVRYRAFISYSHADARWAAWLHRALETYRVPRRLRSGAGGDPSLPDRLAPVFRDREELSSGQSLGPLIESALADSEALIVICSPAAAQSRWVGQEIVAFKRLRPGAPMLALIVAGEPHSGEALECFPAPLRFELEPDGSLSTREAEPLAADVRPAHDGKALALSKIAAGLLGVGLDALRQREAQRRHQRMLAVTALAVAVMLVTSFLGVQAMIARQAAERRQKQAEALVDFMLGDLNDKLNEVSRSDIMEGVNDRAMAYFRSLPASDVTDEALAQRSKALVKIGNVRLDQGQLPKALESYQAAEALIAPLARKSPADLPRQLAYADVLAFIGMVKWYQGDLDKAEAHFAGAQRVLEAARALAPANPQLLYQFSTLVNNSGHVLESHGRIAEATAQYLRMRELATPLARLPRARKEWIVQLGLAHNNLAKMALLRGDMAGAVAGYRADLAIEQRLASADPRDNSQAEKLVISTATLGRTLALAGDLDDGAALLERAVADARRLLAGAADNNLVKEDLGLYSAQLARVHRLQGRGADAAAAVDAALATLRALVATDASNLGWQRELAEAISEQAEQSAAAGRADEARAQWRSALAILEPMLAQQPDDRATLLATLAARLGAARDEDGAARATLLAHAAARLDADPDNPDPRLRALRVQLLALRGDGASATRLADALWDAGYRDAGLSALRHPTRLDPAASPLAADAP
jgi:tetratricopeptide (TPR) repeat protein